MGGRAQVVMWQATTGGDEGGWELCSTLIKTGLKKDFILLSRNTYYYLPTGSLSAHTADLPHRPPHPVLHHHISGHTGISKATCPLKEQEFSLSGPLHSPISHKGTFRFTENHTFLSRHQETISNSLAYGLCPHHSHSSKAYLLLKLLISDPGNFPDPSNLMWSPNV